MKPALIAGLMLIFGCAQKQMVEPSGAGVTSGLGRVGQSVTDARKYNDLAVIHNANATTTVERIDAKAKVIEKYWGK